MKLQIEGINKPIISHTECFPNMVRERTKRFFLLANVYNYNMILYNITCKKIKKGQNT